MSSPGGDRAILPQLNAYRIRLTNKGKIEPNTGANRLMEYRSRSQLAPIASKRPPLAHPALLACGRRMDSPIGLNTYHHAT